MNAKPDLATVAALIGEPSRATMLSALLGGQSLPAGELAVRAGVSPQTASAHLHKLVSQGLLTVEPHGRHRYYRLSNAEVAHALEVLGTIAPERAIRSLRESDDTRRLRFARTCYDHLAGRLGVVLRQALERQGVMQRTDNGFVVPPEKTDWWERFGIPLDAMRTSRRKFAPLCLDWSEREHHVAGIVGAALADRCFELAWLRRVPSGRAVALTREGQDGLRELLGLSLEGSLLALKP